jgi:hypothetical protein
MSMYSMWQYVDGTTLAYAGDEQQREADIAEWPDQVACPCTSPSGVHCVQPCFGCCTGLLSLHVLLSCTCHPGKRTLSAASAPISLSKLRSRGLASQHGHICSLQTPLCSSPHTAVLFLGGVTDSVFARCMHAVAADTPSRLSCPSPAAVRLRRSRQGKIARSEKPADSMQVLCLGPRFGCVLKSGQPQRI